MFTFLKELISLDNPFRLLYHKIRAVIANLIYWFPSKWMVIIWVTWTNWKTTTCNIIAKWLKKAWKKVFMFSTVNFIIWDKEYVNNTKMTSPDAFLLQRLFKEAKNAWCDIAIIETASHWIKMNRIWWIDYDIAVLTNITQDHLDLHKTMKDYVKTKLKLFKTLIVKERKPWIKKTAVINFESQYKDLFIAETYDSIYLYGQWSWVNLKLANIKYFLDYTEFEVRIPWWVIKIKTHLRWMFNVYNVLAAIWTFVALNYKPNEIEDIVKDIELVPWRLEEVKNIEKFKVFIDYAHTEDALEQVLSTLRQIKWIERIITVFWATWDRDKTKRPIMWQIVSKLSDVIILTEDDNYTENIDDILKDIIPWIERKEWEDFWVIQDREEAIRNALITAKENDVVLIAWKWDEHTIMTNNWPKEWHDKTIVEKILKDIDDNKIIK